MLKKFICIGLLSTLSLPVAYGFTPMSLPQAKAQIKEYYDSGQYNVDVAQVVEQARSVLERALYINKHHKNLKKLAIVLDIDDTSLSDYCVLKQLGFADTDMVWQQIERDVNLPAISPVLALYRWAQSKGVKVFFITARPPSMRKTTEQALINAGYKKIDGLYLLPENYTKKSFAPFKIANRKEISEQGYDIVVNIGDQWSDLEGGYAQHIFKLPNYMYGSFN